jgi:hypothetical protein
MDNRHRPHLASQEPQPLHHRIRKSIESNLMRTPRVIGRIGLLSNPLIPIISVSIQSSNAMTVDADVVATEHESSGLVLVADG